jgi:D-3-phosphoglycerate dehydrogenase / 2-oxoglutarate reductase
MNAIFIDCNAQLGAVWQRVIRPDDPEISVNTKPFEKNELPRVIGDHAIAIDDHSYMPTELVRQCRSLKHIVFLGTGAASYMTVPEIEALGVKVHTIRGYGNTAVAEHTIALMMACCRDLAGMDRNIRAGTWQPQEGVQVLDKTLGVIGYGGIGAEVARIAAGMGMQVIAWNRNPRPDAGVAMVALDELLQRSDVISLNLTLNDETRNFLDAERLARTKPGVILVNTSRGALVDEAALIGALRSGQIRHAGLDVFHNEPLKADHPLAQLPNVTLSAHAAFRTLEASMTLLRRAIDIVKRVQA